MDADAETESSVPEADAETDEPLALGVRRAGIEVERAVEVEGMDGIIEGDVGIETDGVPRGVNPDSFAVTGVELDDAKEDAESEGIVKLGVPEREIEADRSVALVHRDSDCEIDRIIALDVREADTDPESTVELGLTETEIDADNSVSLAVKDGETEAERAVALVVIDAETEMLNDVVEVD